MTESNQNKEIRKKPYLTSYITLRTAIGLLAISFPIVLVSASIIIAGFDDIQQSLSCYYYTNMRNVFVGYLCAFALFLYAYKGYDKRDDIVGYLACFFALGVALFPPPEVSTLKNCNFYDLNYNLFAKLHLFSAALFLLTLSYFSLFLFTLGVKKPTKEKIKRNKVYKTCAYIMIGCVVLIGLYYFWLQYMYPKLKNMNPIFWLESTALWAFAVSWLVKGEAIFKDKKT